MRCPPVLLLVMALLLCTAGVLGAERPTGMTDGAIVNATAPLCSTAITTFQNQSAAYRSCVYTAFATDPPLAFASEHSAVVCRNSECVSALHDFAKLLIVDCVVADGAQHVRVSVKEIEQLQATCALAPTALPTVPVAPSPTQRAEQDNGRISTAVYVGIAAGVALVVIAVAIACFERDRERSGGCASLCTGLCLR